MTQNSGEQRRDKGVNTVADAEQFVIAPIDSINLFSGTK